MTLFRKNYFYELPDDIQSTIYKLIFDRCVCDIQNDKNIKYIDRLYRTTNNPNNTCIYSIIPKGLFGGDIEKEYKYKRVAALEDYRNNKMNEMIYLDREHLITKLCEIDIYTISYFVHPLLAASKTFKKYLTIRINLSGYYDKNVIKYIKVAEDRIEITFIRKLKCNADTYYNVLVGYNILYNCLSIILYSEENITKYVKFIELFRWFERNNNFKGCNIDNCKIFPLFEETKK
jgi:hypothetical protein